MQCKPAPVLPTVSHTKLKAANGKIHQVIYLNETSKIPAELLLWREMISLFTLGVTSCYFRKVFMDRTKFYMTICLMNLYTHSQTTTSYTHTQLSSRPMFPLQQVSAISGNQDSMNNIWDQTMVMVHNLHNILISQ